MHEPENQSKRERGTGSIFQNGSSTWWIAFYDRGIKRRESCNSTDRRDAERLLKRRLAELETNTYVARQNIREDELIEDMGSEYREKQRKSIEHLEARWKLHLMPFFARRRAA